MQAIQGIIASALINRLSESPYRMEDTAKPTNDFVSPMELVRRIRAGDQSAETDLVRRYSQPLMFMLVHRTQNKQLAEDLHQETFQIILKRLRSKESIADPTKLRGFIHKTALNLYIGHVRREARRKTFYNAEMLATIADTTENQLEIILKEEERRAVRELIDEMRVPRDRDVIYRFYILEQDKSLICKDLQLTDQNFDRVISRARKRFRQIVESSIRTRNRGVL